MEVQKFIDVFIKNFKKCKDSWNYEDGCIYKGALDLYKVTNDEKYYKFVLKQVNEFIMEDGKILKYNPEEYNVDNINAGKVLFDLYNFTGNEKYRKALDSLYGQLKSHPRTNEGNFWHKKIYPYQVWLDGLYMAMPLYARYKKDFENEEGLEDIVNQFLKVEKRIKDPKTGLYYHGYDESKAERWSNPETGVSPNFWGRAMGWFIMSMVDTLEILGDFKPAEKIKGMLLEAVDALVKYQDPETSMWYQVIDKGGREGNYLETSGTLMLSYGILKGVRLHYLPESCRVYGEKALEGTVRKYLDTDRMELNGICAVAGLGNKPYRDGSYEYYISERIDSNDHKGVGALLMAYSEYLRL